MTGSFGITFLLTWALNWLELIPWRRAANEHWTKRARRLYPARIAAFRHVWAVSLSVMLAGLLCLPEYEDSWACAWLAGIPGAVLGNYSLSRMTFPEVPFKEWLAGTFMYWLLWLSPLLATVIVAVIVPADFGWRMWVGAAAAAGFVVSLHFGLGNLILRKLQIARAPEERLRNIVATTAQRMNVATPPVWELIFPQPFAFALPGTQELAFSRRLLASCTDNEVAAICAHELAHLGESKFIFAGRILGSLAFLPWVFTKPLCHRYQEMGLVPILATFGLLFSFSFRLGRRMEQRADVIARTQEIEPLVYARALERLYQTSLTPAVMPAGQARIHPHLYDRMLAAGMTPTYPRPKPPARISWLGITTIAFVALLFVLQVLLH